MRIAKLPDDALAAAAAFHADALPGIVALLAEPAAPSSSGDDRHLALVFPRADHAHRGWRLVAVQALARAHAPTRVNAIAGDDEAAIAAAAEFLARAPGVTGQYLPVEPAGSDGRGDAMPLSR